MSRIAIFEGLRQYVPSTGKGRRWKGPKTKRMKNAAKAAAYCSRKRKPGTKAWGACVRSYWKKHPVSARARAKSRARALARSRARARAKK